MLEASKNRVPLKSYSVEMGIDSANRLLRIKKKLNKPVT